jgi:hypothetical protein
MSDWKLLAELPEEREDELILIAVRNEWYGICGEEDERKHVEAVVARGTIYRTDLQAIATLDDGDEFEAEDILGWMPLPEPPPIPAESK